jgi:hypothetical protein
MSGNINPSDYQEAPSYPKLTLFKNQDPLVFEYDRKSQELMIPFSETI